MPVLYHHEVIYKPGYFTKPEIQKLAFLSHDENRETENIKKWCKLGKENYQKMLDAMNIYLKSEEAINSLIQFPKDIQPCLEYTINNPDTFNTKAFLEKTNFRNLKNEIKVQEDGRVDLNSSIAELMDRCADTALAIHKTKNFKNRKFDEKLAFRALNLLKDSFQIGKEKFANVNGREYIRRPFVLNVPCIMEINPCTGLISDNIEDEIQDPNSSDKECPCNELKAKENACNCEETKTDHCECECDDTCHTQNPCCAKIETFVAELFVVEDEVSCYKPGEIADIENVMMGEKRVKKHRHLQREETYTETEEENNTYNERNNQIDERSFLSSAIDNVIESDLSVDAGASYSSRTGTKKNYKTFYASLDVSYNQSKKNAKKTVQDHTKNVLTRAIEKVEKKSRTLTSRRMINEIEEHNKHIFDGTEYSENKNGIYFFVNKEQKAQVFSHGVRAMLDFYIPDPSKRLQALLEKKFKLKKPKKPCLIIEEIDPKDYLKYIQCYGFTDLEAPPKPLSDIIKSLKDIKGFKKDDWRKGWSTEYKFNIPEGYKAVEWKLEYSKNWPASGKRRVEFEFDGSKLKDYSSGSDDQDVHGPKTINYIGTSGTINIWTNLKEFKAWITVKLVPIEQVDFLPWQLDVYNRIMDKYQNELDEYNRALEEFNRNKQNKFNQNPFMLSETIKEQLKHSALEYITCQFFDEKNGMRNRVKPCGLPQMDIPETEEFGKKVRFLEHAFEWKFMSYMLYPYFWAEKCSWDEKLQEETQNGLFQKFLQSGYARVSVSIKPGFESDIEYFLREGEIWGGMGLPSYGDPNYLPIHQEIKESKDNFNTDREGYLIWDSSLGLQKDEIAVRNNPNPGPVEYIDNIPFLDSPANTIPNPNFGHLDPLKVETDINRVVVIDCIEYRIVSIDLVRGEVILKLDRDLEHKDQTACPNDFTKRYKDRSKLWSTGAKFVGAPWVFLVPTSLTWLKEDKCLPCFPVKCKENC